MKTLPTALATHYAGGTTTLADLLKITRKDGQVFAFTSASTDATISGQLYTSAQGLDISSLEVTAGLAVDNLELTTLDDGTVFSRVEVLAGKWRNADFVISRYNWASPSDGVEVRMVGTVGEVHLKRGSITAELRGLQQYLQQPIGSVTSKTCRARLGDALCGVALAGYTSTGTVSSSAGKQVFSGAMGEAVPGDASYNSVSLLFHGDGVNGSTTITDSSPRPKTVTAFGNAKISTAQSKYGGASLAFDGGGDYVSSPNSAEFDFGTGDYTLEFDVYVAASTGADQVMVAYSLGAVSAVSHLAWDVFRQNSDGKLVFNQSHGGTLLYQAVSPSALSLSAWHHVVAQRTAGVNRLMVDGALAASVAAPNSPNTNASFAFYAGGISTQLPLNGCIDNLRITKGVARYTAPFTPPTEAHLATLGSGGGTFAADWFSGGLVTFNTGANAGLSQKVKAFDAAGSFTLSLPMLQDVAVGDTYTAIAGCQKRLEDCSGKFNNVLNFQGEPHLPGVDQITAPA